ncbi:hypothetical protein QBC39DRAFT_368185 [Podospora conica]|nr:hypothetical protein QBC39DRAFT_368185 [Schizothecium conicum]
MATSDCQMLGQVLDLWPAALDAVKRFKDTKPDAESRSVARGLNTEAALYKQLIAKILLLTDASSIQDPELQKKVTAKLDVEKTALLLTHLREMHRLLTTLIKDFGNTSRGTTVLRALQLETPSSKAHIPKSKMQRRVDKVSRANVHMTVLLESRSPLSFPDAHHSPSTTQAWYHHDDKRPAEALKAIIAAYRCSCSKSHVAGLRCACSRCNPGFAEAEPKPDDWDFEVAFCHPDPEPTEKGRAEGESPPEDSPASPSSEKKTTTWTSRLSLEAIPRASQTTGDICSFLATKDKQAARPIPHLKSLNPSPKTFSSFHDVIQGRTPQLDTRKRLALAYRLSSAVLQFSGTPWADRSWKLKDWFVGLDTSRKDGFPVVFLNRQINPRQEETNNPKQLEPAWGVASREPFLTMLGIALAELALGRSLADVRRDEPELLDKEHEKAYDPDLLDLFTTTKILSLRYIAQAISPAFESVVRACVTQQYRDSHDASVRELDTKESTFLERATVAILHPLYLEAQRYLGYRQSNSSANASSRTEKKRSPASPVHKHAEMKNWKQPAAPSRRARPPASDTLRPSRQFSPPPPAASSGSEGVFVDSLTNTTKTDAAVATRTSGTGPEGRANTPRLTDPTSSQRISQQSSGLDTPAGESNNDDAGSMIIRNGDVDSPPSCGEDLSSWSFGDYSESDQSIDSAFAWLPSDEHFIRRLHDRHPLLALSDMALKKILTEFRISMAVDRAGGGAAPTRQAASNFGSQPPSTAGGGGRKRQRPGHGRALRKPDDEDEDDEYHQSPPASRADPFSEDQGPAFACPFFKKDSIAHQACYRFRLTRIRDVKQHIGRKHSMPIYCPLCFNILPNERERDDHVREKRCPEKPFDRPEGTTEEQKRKLGRRAPATQSREDQWYGIFYILFDESVERPLSPYLEIDGVLYHGALSLQKYIEGDGVQVLDTLLSEQNAVTWNIPYGEEDAAAFRHHILERAVRVMFQNWEARMGRGATTVAESLPTTSEPTQGSSDIYPMTPSSTAASQAGTSAATPQARSHLPLRPLGGPLGNSSGPPGPPLAPGPSMAQGPSMALGPSMQSVPSFGGPHYTSSNPGFAPINPGFGGEVVFAEEMEDIFGMTALNLENGMMDLTFDTSSFYTGTSNSEAGQTLDYVPFGNYQH